MLEILQFLAGFMLLIFVILFTLYILGSIGLMGIAKKLNITGGWMAWIPIFSFYLLGKIAYNKGAGWFLAISGLLSGNYNMTINDEQVASSPILPAPLNTFVSLAFVVFLFTSLHKVYDRMSDKAVIMTVTTVLTFGLLSPIYLFAIRNNEVRE